MDDEPTIKNCMLAEMEGLKEQSVYKFMNNMIVSKGATLHEGIYLGIDNDPAGQRFLIIFKAFLHRQRAGTSNLSVVWHMT